jgi:hypothetical protein
MGPADPREKLPRPDMLHRTPTQTATGGVAHAETSIALITIYYKSWH